MFDFGRLSETLNISVNSDGKLVKKYHTRYLAGSDVDLTNDEVFAAIGILPGAPHYIWTNATCNDMKCETILSREPSRWWYVDYDHSTDATVPNDDADTDPALRRVNRSVSSSEQQIFIFQDEDGILILDAAGTPVDGGVPVTDFMGTITWERDETHTSTSMSQAAVLSGKTNLTTFMGCAPNTLMLTVTSKEKWEGNYHFWTFTYTMTYKKDGWQPAPANAGLWQIGYGGERERIKEPGDDSYTQEPQPLYADGTVIPVASRPGACNFLNVLHYPRLEFADLALPTT